MRREDREYQIYKGIAYLLRLSYPTVKFHFDYAGCSLSKTQAGLMKIVQGKRGWPDFFLAKPVMMTDGRMYHGCFIEVKKEGTRLFKRNGEPVDSHIAEQQECMAELAECDYYCSFGVGLTNCMQIIEDYLKGKL